ncbi:sigma-70 family RNA polymerase sigma factor [Guptibacillus algicola]|uniref:sigma-70 family RNA polymerase sigma factor n=1 Tax=Guptibacillus algicola TaxID=225844 RepID=UPI001CD32BFA|nr:sigma-70 family RNA polymerase sigma factor [Alkalihalobacillus algicola]MCA0988518.1 sigma-70 family RNA polymerase sigma factor [Alkalihalobacillus algicola]
MEDSQKDLMLENAMVQYGEELTRLAYTYVKDTYTAKDIVQNSFIKYYEKIHTFREEATLKTWLYRITINECKDYLKSWSHRKLQVFSFIQETARGTETSVENSVIQQSTNEEIKEIVLNLPTKYKEVIFLYFYHSLKIEEIAEVTSLTSNTVKTRLRRGKQKLKTLMEEAEMYG